MYAHKHPDTHVTTDPYVECIRTVSLGIIILVCLWLRPIKEKRRWSASKLTRLCETVICSANCKTRKLLRKDL